MRPQAKPGVNFFTRVDIETDDRRRRLQERTGYSVPRLVDEALRNFEDSLVCQLSETERRAYFSGARS
jgi:hypothetical protein